LSKLANLRGNKTAPVAIFATNVDQDTQDVFKRMQDPKAFAPSSNAKKVWKPSRFRCNKGETKRLVILDEKISYAQAEHSVKDKDGKWATCRCIAAWDICPVCGLEDHRPADVVILTVLDLTPWTYTDKKGNVVKLEYTKRELPIKKTAFPIYQNIAAANGGNLRGIVLDMTRGHGDKEAGTGVPAFVMKLSEEELIESFGHDEVTNEEGRIVKAANADIQVFEYAKVHKVPTAAELRALVGLSPRPGSRQEAQEDNTPPWEEAPVQLIDLSEGLPDVD
jgi:hypothetical protein